MKEYVLTSLIASLAIQWITLLTNVFSLLQPLAPQDFVLKEILGVETLVQGIELGFYTWYQNHVQMNLTDVTKFRYYDWFVTTPLMLFSTMAFYQYLQQKKSEPLRLLPFFKENSSSILTILFFNLLMLLFGYLQEIGIISIGISSILGFGALFASFGKLYTDYVAAAPKQFIFFFVFFVWSLYGIAAMFTNHWKNTSYNILDIFAKNFYGVYLSYFIYSLSGNLVGNV